uniref:Uncharacterized protein n=1 Tax=Avena sativa TaxID=4498 RepID=A0ACD5Z9J9_AVESA
MAAATTWSSFFLITDARPAHASCIPRERDALLAFNEGINDTDGYLGSWQQGGRRQHCCRWVGISCNKVTGHVTQLDLGQSFLVGHINPSLISLEHLEYLNLNGTGITGPNGVIPEFLGSFQSLKHLDLSEMPAFSGILPRQLGNLTKLEYLDLSTSNSAVYSTDVSWLSRLPRLVYLDMSYMNLSSIPADWPLVVNMLPSLEYLGLRGCSLSSASQPLTHLNLTNLQHLDLFYNNLSHPIASSWFWNITSMEHLNLDETYLYGAFPDALGNMTSLMSLRFSHFADSVTIVYPTTMTVDLKNLCDLERLTLDESLSGGNITEFIDNLPQCSSNRLQYLAMHSNNMVGMMPTDVGKLTSLQLLILSHNNITGPIPPGIGDYTYIEYLDLAHNYLTGSIPPHIASCTRLVHLLLSDNRLSAHIPSKIGMLRNLTELDLSRNSLDGEVTREHLVISRA